MFNNNLDTSLSGVARIKVIAAKRRSHKINHQQKHGNHAKDTVRQAQSGKWEARSSTTGVSPKKQAKNAKLWR